MKKSNEHFDRVVGTALVVAPIFFLTDVFLGVPVALLFAFMVGTGLVFLTNFK